MPVANMMAGVILGGIAESGYGITLAGFHCPNIEVGARLQELLAKLDRPSDIAQFENNGYTTLLLCARSGLSIPLDVKVAMFRREPHKFFQDLPEFLKSTKAQFVDRMILIGSLGSISLTVLYRPSLEP